MAFAYRLSKTVQGSRQSADIVPIKGIVFDMDGTLTEPVLDFKELRQNLAIPQGVDILQYISNRPTQSETDEMYSKLLEFEARGASDLRLQKGAKELLRLAAKCQVKRALVTRNTQNGIEVFLNKLGDPSSYGGQFTHVSLLIYKIN
jgi:phosphoglycolate phosphatase-like HAD superfamily hydrolase